MRNSLQAAPFALDAGAAIDAADHILGEAIGHHRIEIGSTDDELPAG
jgi:hypothetical protein